jgi:hypothetical protein
MDETSFLLPACSSSSSPSGSVQPDRANGSGSSSSRVLVPDSEAPSRYRGLREMAHLFRDSVPGASSSRSHRARFIG